MYSLNFKTNNLIFCSVFGINIAKLSLPKYPDTDPIFLSIYNKLSAILIKNLSPSLNPYV